MNRTKTKAIATHLCVGLALATTGVVAGTNMKHSSILSPSVASAQPEAVENMQMDMQAAMKAWKASMTPGDMHKWLGQFVGEWDMTMRIFMAPGAPPIESKGHSTHTMAMDGHYLVQHSTFDVMMPDADNPMKMDTVSATGIGIVGYDNMRKLFHSTWFDSMGTSPIVSRGSLNMDKTVMTMFGTMDEPMTGEIGKTVRAKTTIVNPDQYVFEISEVIYGDEIVAFEIQYDRAG